MSKVNEIDPNKLRNQISRLRGEKSALPDASIVIPVNAQGDLKNVLKVLNDIAEYDGINILEVILVINNYSPEKPPSEIITYCDLGLKVIGIPDVRRPGEAVGFSARIPGIKEAACEKILLFDADVRIKNSNALIDWYIREFKKGAALAYTHVGYFDLRESLSIRFRIVIHHLARWIKRVILKIPTARGSNYAVQKTLMLELYAKRSLADEMNVGPVFKSLGEKIVYSGAKNLNVLTSGRMFTPGWRKIFRYFRYRLKYNIRVLPVRTNVATFTKRENDLVRRYDDNNVLLK
jgi:hypothetical protein